jgi:DNA polymerase/3'-5' exonuclease PolX
VDFFLTTHEAWFNYLVCRTGSANSNMRIAVEARKRGYKWLPFGNGFEEISCGMPNGKIHQMNSEREVFEFVGLPFVEPELRI